MGQISVRIIGELADIDTFVKSLESIYGRLNPSPPKQNMKGDVGFRVYVFLTVGRPLDE